MTVVTLAWTTIESALGNGRTAPEAIAALTRSSAAEINELFRRIGAGDAGRLLMQAQSGPPVDRRAKLTACLAAVDNAVAAGGHPPKSALGTLWPRRADQSSRYRDVAQSALLASLIEIELDSPLEARRARFAAAATALESHIAAVRHRAAGQDMEAYVGRARAVFVQASRLVIGDRSQTIDMEE